jgi:hypothetical protein
MRTHSTVSFASTSSSTLNDNINYLLNPVEKEQFEYYRNKEGLLEKYSSAFLVGWQKRYWKIRCNKNFLLSYFKEEKKEGEPQGILNIPKIKDIKKDSDKK